MTHSDRSPRLHAVVVLALGLVACAAPEMPVSRPSPTPLPALRPSSALQVVALDGLTLQDAPPGAEPLETVPTTLDRGEDVWVVDITEGPDGSLALVVVDRDRGELLTPFGWVPAEIDGVPTLTDPEWSCPTQPLEVADVIGLGRFGGLACFGDDSIELIGFAPVGCGIGGSPREGEPEWLNGTWSGVAVADAVPQPDVQLPMISVRIAPPGDFGSACGTPARHRFTGHFDDPASATCRTTESTEAGPVTLDGRLSTLLCRTQLVITAAEPIGGG